MKEVLDQIVEWKWVNPAPLSRYEKYLPSSGGDVNTIVLTPRSPNPVSNSPDVGQTLWHPLLVDSEHAYAWWMMSPENLQTIIAEIQKKAEVKATSRMTGSTPKQQVVIKKHKAGATNQPKGTPSKSGSDGSITLAKSTSSSSPADQGIQIKQELGQTREPKGPPVPGLQSRGIKRDKLNGTNRAEFAVFRRFSLSFADFRFSWEL